MNVKHSQIPMKFPADLVTFTKEILKGHLRYKTILCLFFFLSEEKIMFRSPDIEIFVFL